MPQASEGQAAPLGGSASAFLRSAAPLTSKSANGLGEVSAGHMDGERRYLDKTRGAMLKLRCAWIWRVDNAVAWIQGASW
jgi:hypothetical protein